jgi:hypothetical protein
MTRSEVAIRSRTPATFSTPAAARASAPTISDSGAKKTSFRVHSSSAR